MEVASDFGISPSQRPLFRGGRYWVRTSDLFGVNEARYHCANRPRLPTIADRARGSHIVGVGCPSMVSVCLARPEVVKVASAPGSPRGSGKHADVAQLVEHHLAKVRVAGSNPVVRSELVSYLPRRGRF